MVKWVWPKSAVISATFLVILSCPVIVHGSSIPTTVQGPFKPVTAALDPTLRRNATDLPESDPRLRRPEPTFQPEQISVSLSYHYDSIWISWITGEFQVGEDIVPLDPESVQSVVEYGVFGKRMTSEANGSSLIYNQLYPFESLESYTSGIIHHVQLTGLKPGTLYQYRCGDPSIPAMSEIHYFRTMPVSTTVAYPSRIAVVGDLGLAYNTSVTFSHMLSSHPELLILVGGMSYADTYFTNGTRSNCDSCFPVQETYQPRWDHWGRFMEPLTANVPTMVVEGDHEIEPLLDNLTFVAYSSRFVFPSKESGSLSTLYYSFNAGGIHFVMLSAYVPYDGSSEQYKWLENDLSNVNRSVTPWLVAAWSPPWYSTYKKHFREAECMRIEFESLLYNYGVDIVFNGQVEAYERSNRVYNYTMDPCGPVYITVGGGGSGQLAVEHADEPRNCPEPSEDHNGESCAFNFTSGPASGMFCWDRQPDYSAYRESSFGYGILEVKNETHALWSWHRNQDSFLIAGDIIYVVRQPEACRANE